MLRRVLIVVAVVDLAAVVVLGLTHGRGADSGEAALAIRGTHDIGFSGAVRLEVECADHIRVEVRDDPDGSGLQQVTVWGRPRIGRCQPEDAYLGGGVTDELPRAADGTPATKFVDGATSQVVELP